MQNDLHKRIAAARGLNKADLVLKGGAVVNVFSGEIYRADVAVADGIIVGVGDYDGKKRIDASSGLILPGLIDGHVHIESSMLTPAEFARAVLPQGTTAIVADPHEIANVLGKAGIRSMLDGTEGLPLDVYFMLPSCVPATDLESAGASLRAGDLIPFLKHKRVLGLAEMMNYEGVLSGDPEVLRKLKTFARTRMDGHAPGLRGRNLSAYAAAGLSSDHESLSAAEAAEKIRNGMTVFIRESSAAKGLHAILPAVTQENARSFCFATDDLQPGDLKKGNINLIVKKAVRMGLDPVTAIRMATINPAQYFNLRHKGAIAPGYSADMIVVSDLKTFSVQKVFKNGKLVARDGKMVIQRGSDGMRLRNSVKTGHIAASDIRLAPGAGRVRIIEIIPDQIETRQRIMPVIVDNAGMVANDRDRDIAKAVVVERHRSTGRTGIGLVKGFGLKAGAFASTVAHDSHNIIAVGMYDEDIIAAIREIRKLGGGLVVVRKEKLLASLPLPIAGIMSDRPLDFVVKAHTAAVQAVRKLGVKLAAPFAALSFLSLPVIPELKLTDRGLVDVKQFKVVDLFV